jgi:hypothetical protein
VNEVILVPRRADDGPRDALWEWCRQWWEREQSHMPIFEGHHDEGLFNRSAAVNRASALAGDWDVAVIIDSDVICNASRVKEAVALAHETGKLVYPHDIRKDLDNTGSRIVMHGEKGNWERWVRRRYRNMVSSVIVVPRRLWDEVGGFDEEFRGWGYEDTAFAAACETFGGSARLSGEVWHFWHPTAKEGKPGTATWQVNAARGQRYRAAIGKPDVIRAIRAERTQVQATDSIPRILHRVVPEHTDAQAETWWSEFQAMHPGWEFRTHRDPLDPKDWPISAPHWGKCRNGPQFADLIRLEALVRDGGIYVDQDMQPLRPLDPLLPLHAFAAWEDANSVPNAVLGARTGHPALKEALDLAIERLSVKDRPDRATWAAGPGVTTKVLVGRDDVLVLPPGSFYEVHYRDARERLPNFDKKAAPWAFALHHWWGSWLAPEARWNDYITEQETAA